MQKERFMLYGEIKVISTIIKVLTLVLGDPSTTLIFSNQFQYVEVFGIKVIAFTLKN